MKKNLIIVLLLTALGSLSAQTFLGKLNPFPAERQSLSSVDTVKILAVMVNFQEDKDAATFGNGKFGSIYTKDYGNSILDPLPHDRQYFEDHLEFVRRYYQKNSNGRVIIEYHVLPDTFSVSQTMRNYSPDNNSADFSLLGNFAEEVWSIAADMYPAFKFSDYNLFVIFHAGVGRDISLPGSLGNEKDLPSVYLSEKALKEIFGEGFNGFPVKDGQFRITNTMIMPETESRELSTLTGTVLFEITINGLLVASVASHLGLPDLFNTETGLSAIGRFGLMDGQSIFAYNGTFPPEPSAWEKIYLGWAEPVTILPDDYDISLVTRLAASLSDTVILKVPLNSTEYYLIENRNRDANNNGSTVHYKIGDIVYTKTFFSDTTGYRSFDTDELAGVIIDVDEFDWALPGSGILIWHIDENVINEKLASNTINNDKARRGVNLKEADGIPDIGEKFFTIFGDEVIGEGTQEDLWYSSNPAVLYQNKLAKDTRPNSLTNTGANSLITISDFSDIDNRMSFKIAYGDSLIKPLFTTNLESVSEVLDLSYFETGLSASASNLKFILRTDSALIILDNSGNIVNSFSLLTAFKTASASINNIDYLIQSADSVINIFMQNGSSTNSVNTGEIISTSPVILQQADGTYHILIGTLNGKVLNYLISDTNEQPILLEEISKGTSLIITKIAGNDNFFSFIGRPTILSIPSSPISLFFDNAGNSYSFLEEIPVDLGVTKDKNGKYVSVVLTSTNKFYVFSFGELLYSFKVEAVNPIISFSLTDLRKDGNIYIVFNNGNKLEARNFEGALADNYPIVDPEGMNFVATPLSLDFEGNNCSEIIAFTEDGRIFAFDGPSGRLVYGFPISAGAFPLTVPVLFSNNGIPSVAVIDKNKVFSAWNIGAADGKYYWAEKNGNSRNTSYISGAETVSGITEFFPKNRAYNYPNPVYDGQTFIRYYVSEESKINIKIFDLAGGFVAELNDFASGGMDSETLWNVGDIQSGVYLARIEAVSSSGKSESQVIKIAVVK